MTDSQLAPNPSSSASSSAQPAEAAQSHPSATFIESQYHRPSPSRRHDDSEDDEGDDGDDDDDDERLFAELDKELDAMEDQGNFHTGVDEDSTTVAGFDMAEFRERRMEELRQEIAAARSNGDSHEVSLQQHTSSASMKGLLTEITNEKDLIQFSSSERQVAIHFFHPKFSRCALLDRHLTVLARLHPTTLFVKANVNNTPFLVQKLKISVLPCLITFKDGVSKDKIVGFEELGNSDKFSTGALEWRLGQSGIIDPRENRKPIFGFVDSGDSVGRDVVGKKNTDEQDDFWDDE